MKLKWKSEKFTFRKNNFPGRNEKSVTQSPKKSFTAPTRGGIPLLK